MRRYSSIASVAVGTDLGLLLIISATTIRPEVYEIQVSCGLTPDDKATLFEFQRFTASGTGTAVTPRPLDPDDPAALASAEKGTFSPDPTWTANLVLLYFALNQRIPYRFFAYPGSEFKLPATADNGIGLKSESSGGTASHAITIFHGE